MHGQRAGAKATAAGRDRRVERSLPSLLRHRRRGAVSLPPAARVREDSQVANEYAQWEEGYSLTAKPVRVGEVVTRSCRPAATRATEKSRQRVAILVYNRIRYNAPTRIKYIQTFVHQILAKQTKVLHDKQD